MKKSIRMAVTAALAVGSLSIGGGQAYAANDRTSADEHSLGETVVTATRMPLSVRQAPANVAVITAQEIEQNHYRSVSEALEHVNGVVVDRASGEEYVRLNGDDRVVVMVDGVRLNNDQGVVNGRAGVDLHEPIGEEYQAHRSCQGRRVGALWLGCDWRCRQHHHEACDKGTDGA